MTNREKIKYVIQEGKFTQPALQAVTEKWLINPGMQHTMQNAVSACEAEEKHYKEERTERRLISCFTDAGVFWDNGESLRVYQGILLCHRWQHSQFFLIAVQVQQINAVTAGQCQTTCFETQPISC